VICNDEDTDGRARVTRDLMYCVIRVTYRCAEMGGGHACICVTKQVAAKLKLH